MARWAYRSMLLVLALSVWGAEPDHLVADEDAADSSMPRPVAPIGSGSEDDNVVRDNVMTEHYPDGSIKWRRSVVRDEIGSYVCHGPCSLFDQDGRTIGEGSYRHGKRHGTWTRLVDEADFKAVHPDTQFRRPFVSKASFVAGVAHGPWQVCDAEQRSVCRWHFRRGQLHGKAVWWYPDGARKQEYSYENGRRQGTCIEWSRDGTCVKETFVEGRRLVRATERYTTGEVHQVGWLLMPREVLEISYEWWAPIQITAVGTEGTRKKHGRWTHYARDGHPTFTGEFAHDAPVGRHTWYDDRGQKQRQGTYHDGLRHGVWTWWHPNGCKRLEGRFEAGMKTGRWVHWTPTGRMAATVDYRNDQPGPEVKRFADGRPSTAKSALEARQDKDIPDLLRAFQRGKASLGNRAGQKATLPSNREGVRPETSVEVPK